MTFFQSFILGLTQGLTEFLPVSSSAHLVFVQHLLGFKDPLLFFDIVVHLGTLAALFVYFAADLAHIIRDSLYGISYLFRGKPLKEIWAIVPHARWALGVFLACVPTALAGFFFRDWFEGLFGSLKVTGITLIMNSGILWLTRYFRKGERGIENARWWDYVLIGIMQAVSIIPGISRSGATIATGLFLGLRTEAAFRFSFLLAIPAILGAGFLELKNGFVVSQGHWGALAIGFFTAALFGFLSIVLLDKVTQKGKLHIFAFYTLLLGFAILTLFSRLE